MIYHYFGGGSSGVARFDSELRKVFRDPFPRFMKITEPPRIDVTSLSDSEPVFILGWQPEDVVICDNHLSLNVPEEIKAIVVAHGCAATHFERDCQWGNDRNRKLVNDQQKMIGMLNRKWVYPSLWIADEFSRHNPNWMRECNIIPNWVEQIDRPPSSGKPIIIGDWRDNNKGSSVWRKLADANPQWDFRPLNFRTDAEKREQYGTASLYLCLSLSEGGSYSMCDAEATGLPIVTTDVGNYLEFTDCEVIRWQDRDNVQIVSDAIERKLKAGRQKPSFYQEYTFDKWAEVWRNVVSL